MNKSKLPVIQSGKKSLEEARNLPRSGTYVVETAKKATTSQAVKQLSPVKKEGTFTKATPTVVKPVPQIEPPKPKPMSLAQLKQQKRAELRKAQSDGFQGDDSILLGDVSINTANSGLMLSNHRALEAKLKEARKSGQLNLSNYGLEEGIQLDRLPSLEHRFQYLDNLVFISIYTFIF